MGRSKEDLSVYDEVEIPEAMQGDPLKNHALSEIDCPRGRCRDAASETYKLVEGLYRVSRRQHFIIHPRVVVRAYGLTRDRQKKEARRFTLLHVLLRGIYMQLWLESNEDYGVRYRSICGTNQLIDEAIQWMHSGGRLK